MPQYVSLAQQGFFEPFQAIGNALARTAGILQENQKMKQQASQFGQEQNLRRDIFNNQKETSDLNNDNLRLALRKSKAQQAVSEFDPGEAMKGMTEQTDYQPPSTGMGLDPAAASEVDKSRPWTPVKRQVNLDTTDWNQLSPDMQRMMTAKVNEQVAKAGGSPISSGDVAQAYRQKQYEKISPSLPSGAQITGGKIALPGQGEVSYAMGSGNGTPILSPEEQAKIAGGLNGKATEAYKNYFDAHGSYLQMGHQVDAADKKTGPGNSTAAEDVSIMNLYLNTIDPRIRLTPNSTEDLKHHVESLPSKYRIAANKLVGGNGSLTPEERHELLNAAYQNTLGHHENAQEQAGVISDSGSQLGAGNFSVGIKPNVSLPLPPAGGAGHTPDRSVQGAPHGGGDSTQPGTYGQPSAGSTISQQFGSPAEFDQYARTHRLAPGTKAQVFNPATKRIQTATFSP